MAGIPWTDKELKALEELCRMGKSVKEIMASGVFGKRQRHSIENKASCMGWSFGLKDSGFDEKKFKELINGGRRDKDRQV